MYYPKPEPITLTSEQSESCFRNMLRAVYYDRPPGKGLLGIVCCNDVDEIDGVQVFVAVHDNDIGDRREMFRAPVIVQWDASGSSMEYVPYLTCQAYPNGDHTILKLMSEQLHQFDIHPVSMYV